MGKDENGLATFGAISANSVPPWQPPPGPNVPTLGAYIREFKTLRWYRLQGRRDRHKGWVYFISDGTAVKVGFARSVPHRLKALQTSHHVPLKVIARFRGSFDDENSVHHHLRSDRIRREWFKRTPAMDALIASLRILESPVAYGVLSISDVLDRRRMEELMDVLRSDTRRKIQPVIKAKPVPKPKAISRRKECKALADQIAAQAKPYLDEMPAELRRVVRHAELSARFSMASKAFTYPGCVQNYVKADLAAYAAQFPAWLAGRNALPAA